MKTLCFALSEATLASPRINVTVTTAQSAEGDLAVFQWADPEPAWMAGYKPPAARARYDTPHLLPSTHYFRPLFAYNTAGRRLEFDYQFSFWCV